MRFNAQTATIENGFVHLPQRALWLAEYIHEITTFPGSKYDDQADSTSQALAWINQSPPEDGVFRYYRLENALIAYQQGMSLATAAASEGLTEAELQEWIKQKQLIALESMYLTVSRSRCAKCGETFPLEGTHVRSGGLEYHEECFRQFTMGR